MLWMYPLGRPSMGDGGNFVRIEVGPTRRRDPQPITTYTVFVIEEGTEYQGVVVDGDVASPPADALRIAISLGPRHQGAKWMFEGRKSPTTEAEYANGIQQLVDYLLRTHRFAT